MIRKFFCFLFFLFFSYNLVAQSGVTVSLSKSDNSSEKVFDTYLFPGGEDALYKYISDNVKYPPLLIKIEMEGDVSVKVKLNEKGKVQDVEILRGFDPLADDEVVRVLKRMPKWDKVSSSATTVGQQFQLLITFKLNDYLREFIKDPQNLIPKNTHLEEPVKEPEVEDAKDSIPVLIVDSLNRAPLFSGGQEALDAYFAANLKYPKRAIEYGIEGRVLFNITITAEGEITNIRLLKGIFMDCNEEAFYLIKKMPRWIPGLKDGKAVAMSVVLPIPFVLPK